MIRILVALLLLSASYTGYTQCCAAGNPVSTDGANVDNNKKALTISLQGKNSSSVNYFHGSKRYDDDFLSRKSTGFNFTSFSVSYGITDKLKINADMGYFISKGETMLNLFHPETNEPFSRKSTYQLGDASLNISYILYSSNSGKFFVIPQYTAKFPVGSFNAKDWVGVLPIDLQPSTGSFRYNPGIIFYRKITRESLSVSSIFSAEFIDKITMESGQVYKYGNIYSITASGYFKPFKHLLFSLFGRYEIRNKRVDNGNEIQESTGGSTIVMAGKASYTFKSGFTASIMYDRPVYRYMNYIENGTGQLGNRHIITVKVSKRINFHRTCCPPEELCTMELTEVSFPVYGICGMCKDRIEQVCLKFKNVKFVDWNMSSNTVIIKHTDDLDIELLKQKLADKGHDTDTIKASEKAYERLHVCCKYR